MENPIIVPFDLNTARKIKRRYGCRIIGVRSTF